MNPTQPDQPTDPAMPTPDPAPTPPQSPAYTPGATVDGLTVDSVESPQQRAKRTGKKVVFGILALLVVGGAVAGGAYYFSAAPSKADYAAAAQVQTEILAVGDEMSAANTVDPSTLTLETSQAGSVKQQARLDEIDTKLSKFKDLKVMKNAEVAQAYNAFNDKFKKTKQVLVELNKAMPLVVDLRDKCRAMGESAAQAKLRAAVTPAQIIAAFNETTQPCIDAAKNLKVVEVEPIAQYAASIESAIATLRLKVEVLATAKTTTELNAAQASMSLEQQKIVDAGETLIEGLKKLKSEVSLNAELEALKKAIDNAQSKALI